MGNYEHSNHFYVFNVSTLTFLIQYRYSPIKGYDPIENQRKMERYATDHDGYVAPYAETQLTFEEFNEMFAHGLKIYDKLRKLNNSEKAFPHVYEKISKLGRS